jgi:Cdc6-like AAA superfamily ATPase
MSRLNLEDIEFKPYTIQEMKDIIQERIENAFHNVEEGVAALTAAHAINKSGDVRVGLQCLMKAGRLAEKEKSDKLKTSHIKSVLKEVKDAKPEILKGNVTDVEKLVVDIVNDGKTTFDELYSEYSNRVESPLTKRMFREYVNHLTELNLIKIGKRKLGKSRFISKV